MRWTLCVLLVAAFSSLLRASAVDEFKVKRQEVFEFTERPVITRQGNEVQIAFTTKGYCDATVAIEDGEGHIVRHLASGVLGANAPEPFAKDSLKQTILWDTKNDQGKRCTNLDDLQVRVSLGLKPSFEKSLYYSPYKRMSDSAPLIHACAEGVLVYDGNGCDSLKLFDREGKYQRTVYPFPADKLDKVKGLDWFDFPQGLRLPRKKGMYQLTLLTSGENSELGNGAINGSAASVLAAYNGRIILAKRRVNRLSIDGSTGDMVLNGPEVAGAQATELDAVWRHIPGGPYTGIVMKDMFLGNGGFHQQFIATPTSAAISPDGKWLYLAGYAWRYAGNYDTMHLVMRMPLDGSQDMKLFAGKPYEGNNYGAAAGTGPGEFKNAASVDCDKQGRVYVADYMNDRIQVFSPDGKHLKDIATSHPAQVRIHRRSDEIYSFSYAIASGFHAQTQPRIELKPSLTCLGTFDDPKTKATYELPMPNFPFNIQDMPSALYCSAEIDSWSDPLTVWIGHEAINNSHIYHPADGGRSTAYESAGVLVLREKDGKMQPIVDFGKEVSQLGLRGGPPRNAIQRLEVNPKTGKLYLGETDSGPTIKNQKTLVEIDPESGEMKIIELPFNALEFAFDIDGAIYLRGTSAVARYEFPSFREIPWDYGEEIPDLGNDAPIAQKTTSVSSALVMPCASPVCFHQGGFAVSPFGDLIASCAYRFAPVDGKSYWLDPNSLASKSKRYEPPMYPGRCMTATSACVQIFDKYGKWTTADAFPGMGQVDGIQVDRAGDIYIMHTPSRMLDGKPYFNEMSETLMKVKPGKARAITSGESPIPLTAETMPKRPQELGGLWVEGAEWFYGGVGFAGFNTPFNGGGCACRFSRFTLDLYARSIVPEPYQFAVGVLDSNGNLILRIGTYGNVDSSGPKSAVPVDGDGIGLINPCYVATHTDRRVFISDTGNNRIVGVRLDYHASEQVQLKDALAVK